ncbi:MAG: 50S ribosomal protein L32 [Armatimonadetes bacterium]|nr:50S ribosomal protein L32 [Armatimonadota bacterium]
MPLPKRKQSKWHRAQRRHQNWKLCAPNIGACPRCHAAKLPHHVCTACGFYQGRKVIEVKERAGAG